MESKVPKDFLVQQAAQVALEQQVHQAFKEPLVQADCKEPPVSLVHLETLAFKARPVPKVVSAMPAVLDLPDSPEMLVLLEHQAHQG